MIIFLIGVLILSSKVSLAWWNSSWQYRIPINITEQSGTNLVNYQVRINLNSSNFDFSKANSDGSDIRFTWHIYELPITITEQSGQDLTNYQVLITITDTEILSKMKSDAGDIRFFEQQVDDPYTETSGKLPYWIESKTDTELKVWVKLNLTANEQKTIYMYYGNPSATSESDGDAVFDFFDDFDDGVIDTNKWRGATSNFTETNGYIETKTSGQLLYTYQTFTDGIIEARVMQSSGARASIAFRITSVSDPTDTNAGHVDDYSANFRPPNSDIRLRKWSGGAETILDSATMTISANTWHRVKVVMHGSSLSYTFDTTTISATDTTYSSGWIGINSDAYETDGSDYTRWDWIRVRKYTDPEPTISIGTETQIDSEAKLPYWIESYSTSNGYVLPITITEQSGQNLTDYQVLITITNTTILSHMKSDAGDIRFFETQVTDPYTETTGKLPYWIELKNDTMLKVWVKLNLTANQSKTIYMYYGNPSASSESNGDAVFEFFDDFDTDKGYTEVGLGSYSVSNSIITVTWEDNRAGMDYNVILNDSFTFSANQYIERIRMRTTQQVEIMGTTHAGGANIDTAPYCTYTYYGTQGDDSTNQIYFADEMYSGSGNFEVLETILACEGDKIALTIDYDEGTTGTYSFDVDWIAIRKYVSVEPSVTIGTEQTVTTELQGQATIWVKVPYIPANGQTVIYMYYGNPDATSESNGTAVFEFFDDFDTDKNYQNVGAGSGTYTISQSVLYMKQTSAGAGIDYVLNISSFDLSKYSLGSLQIESKVKIITEGELHLFLFRNATNDPYNAYKFYGTQQWDDPSIGAYPADVTYSGSGDWEIVGAILNDFTDGSFVGLGIDYDDSTGADQYVDWIRVRKYTSIEPSIKIGEVSVSISVNLYGMLLSYDNHTAIIREINPSGFMFNITAKYNVSNYTIKIQNCDPDLVKLTITPELNYSINYTNDFETIIHLYELKEGNTYVINVSKIIYPQNICFAVTGDIRYDTVPYEDVDPDFIEVLKEMKESGGTIFFTPLLGDIIAGGGYLSSTDIVTSTMHSKLWNTLLYSGVFVGVVGNHDMARGSSNGYSENLWKQYWKLLNFTWEWGKWKFINVDTYRDDGTAPSETSAGGFLFGSNWNWTYNEITNSGDKYLVVMFHQPVYDVDDTCNKWQDSTNCANMRSMLENNGVKLVLNGHDHAYKLSVHGNTTYLIEGRGGADLFSGVNYHGFSMVCIYENGSFNVYKIDTDDGYDIDVNYTVANDYTNDNITATIINEHPFAFPVTVKFRVPGNKSYDVSGADWYYELNNSFGKVIIATKIVTANSTYNISVTKKSEFNIVFKSKIPADITSVNIFLQDGLNISYDVTVDGYNISSVKLYYKTNSTNTPDDCWVFVNGTCLYDSFVSMDYNSTDGTTYKWILNDYHVYPGIYLINEDQMISTQHNYYLLNNPNKYIKVKFENISNISQYNYIEMMVNSSGTQSLRVYYCNESYTSGNPEASPYCTNFYNLDPDTPINHTHSQYSFHVIIPFPIDTETGEINGIKVTSTGYILLRGR
ncbi:MAG: hypothetical protein DRN30_04025, partial [Thermoplasmata archaeon]